jgi:hypothetical protein
VANLQLASLPQGIGGPTAAQLVLQINDRLRRISLAFGDISGGIAGATGPAGPRGASGDSGDVSIDGTPVTY